MARKFILPLLIPAAVILEPDQTLTEIKSPQAIDIGSTPAPVPHELAALGLIGCRAIAAYSAFLALSIVRVVTQVSIAKNQYEARC